MSHVNLAKVLCVSNLVRNIFGTSPFAINLKSTNPKQMVQSTLLSTWAPVITFTLCSCLLYLGIGYQWTTVKNSSNVSKVSGIDIADGSLSMIIMQLTILSAMVTYIVTNVITVVRRKEFRQCMVSMLELCEVLDRKYDQKYDTRNLSMGLWFLLLVLPIYYLIYIFVFEAFLFRAVESHYLIPVAYTVESITASMDAFDLICPIMILENYFTMFGQVPRPLMDEEYMTDFTSALDMFEMIGQNHGHREIFNIGNEVIAVIAQLFYTFYAIIPDDEVAHVSDVTLLYMAFGGVLPRLLKLFYIAFRGSRATKSVSGQINRATFLTKLILY